MRELIDTDAFQVCGQCLGGGLKRLYATPTVTKRYIAWSVVRESY
jgi:hypothetical protein